ncbi:4-hydroxythreonine-4-phosphate dehydrogenase PdxA [Pseudoluteimonas lycopersici]|uniref:4-hydroxythreonine-4-phosphate dehydrogenase n=1 Tax=Pseudoluteimonas lycopersici TaxID=1324796 RepID=A0A516V7V5_9GAMM|nr:4-hydroxythreonine-4-phosphate dehydrogenase PdxA [Lysobacter lycopersici]QDQ74619.1 4-hydroxythreonine-4-phosphate dehydrogenase PdxA [Lysobacter lycopersici]
MFRPRLALVPGEPAGVGPELCARILAGAHPAELVVYGDAGALRESAAKLGIALPAFPAVEFPNAIAATPGQPDPRNAAAVIAALEAAARDCLDGRIDGLVTGPVHKANINAAGIAYTGTTELLAKQARRDVVMMLARPGLRVALATTHLPLRAVPDAISQASLETTLRVLHASLRTDFGIASPVIAVLGLNPHAGEDGVLGREEIETIHPMLAKLRNEGFDLRGPLPADTAFLPDKLPGFDAVLAMYHDQGLPVLKSTGIEHAVNITLGLPYPRVAVDHGTALDIAGKGIADPSSLFAAIAECARMAAHRKSAS